MITLNDRLKKSIFIWFFKKENKKKRGVSVSMFAVDFFMIKSKEMRKELTENQFRIQNRMCEKG